MPNDDTIEQENTELLSRLAGLQQEKWNLEEKVVNAIMTKSFIVTRHFEEKQGDNHSIGLFHNSMIL